MEDSPRLASSGSAFNERRAYVKRLAALCVRHFIDSSGKLNVKSLVVAGPGKLKEEMLSLPHVDRRIAEAVVSVLDVAYGGINGLFQAISKSAQKLAGLRIEEEKEWVSQVFEHMARDTGRYAVGVKDCLKILDSGAVKRLLVVDDLPYTTHTWRTGKGDSDSLVTTHAPNSSVVVGLHPADQEAGGLFERKGRGTPATDSPSSSPRSQDSAPCGSRQVPDCAVHVDAVPTPQWLWSHVKTCGVELKVLTSRSPEVEQLRKGLGGMAAILRYAVEVSVYDEHDSNGDEDDWDGDWDEAE